MSLQIYKRPLRSVICAATLVALAACGDAGEAEQAAKPEAAEETDSTTLTQSGESAIPCALNGTADFKAVCKHSISGPADATQLVLEGPEGDFRRFNLLKDGRGLEAADGAEPAQIAVRDDGTILVTVGADKFILPATVKSATPLSGVSAEVSAPPAPVAQ